MDMKSSNDLSTISTIYYNENTDQHTLLLFRRVISKLYHCDRPLLFVHIDVNKPLDRMADQTESRRLHGVNQGPERQRPLRVE